MPAIRDFGAVLAEIIALGPQCPHEIGFGFATIAISNHVHHGLTVEAILAKLDIKLDMESRTTESGRQTLNAAGLDLCYRSAGGQDHLWVADSIPGRYSAFVCQANALLANAGWQGAQP